jgi:hypothetical protein
MDEPGGVSWFNNNPNDPLSNGYDVYFQILSLNGVEQFPHDGVQIAQPTLTSTERLRPGFNGEEELRWSAGALPI